MSNLANRDINENPQNIDRKSNFRRGSIELMVLHLLNQEDCYGYQLTQLIKELTNGVISIPIGTLYPVLYKLIDSGYISDEKRLVGKRMERVYYHIEESGRMRLSILTEDYLATANAIQTVLAYKSSKKAKEKKNRYENRFKI